METMFNGFEYPDEGVDDHWETLKGFYNQLDLAIYTLRRNSRSFLCGGGDISWDSSSSLMSWSEPFVVPFVESGYVVTLKYGSDKQNLSDNIQPGSCLVAELPAILNENVTVNMNVYTTLGKADNLYVVAYNYSGSLFLRNGKIFT